MLERNARPTAGRHTTCVQARRRLHSQPAHRMFVHCQKPIGCTIERSGASSAYGGMPCICAHQGCVPKPTTLAGDRNRAQTRIGSLPEVSIVGAPGDVLRIDRLESWLSQAGVNTILRAERSADKHTAFVATRDVRQGEVVLEVPEAFALTRVDADAHPLLSDVAPACSELVALTLLVMAERAAGAASKWAPLVQALPASVESPLLWSETEREELLTGSPVLPEARARAVELRQQWQQLHSSFLSADPARYDPGVFSDFNFTRTFCAVLAHALYLPSADLFALVPGAALLGRTGNGDGCTVDYDEQAQSVKVVAGASIRSGTPVCVADERPNGERLLCRGEVQDSNASDCLLFPAELVKTDRYYMQKASIMEAMGFGSTADFPVFVDRFPNQLLSYLRLARIQDPGLIAKVRFDADVVVSQLNEYEVLQLLMGECRERLARYKLSLEEEQKLLQARDLTPRARLAARLRIGEKTILSQFMTQVRRKLAPIRGIPTKGGSMQDPNQDLKEIFEFVEELPKVPGKALAGLLSWARGDHDPDWKKPPKGR